MREFRRSTQIITEKLHFRDCRIRDSRRFSQEIRWDSITEFFPIDEITQFMHGDENDLR